MYNRNNYKMKNEVTMKKQIRQQFIKELIQNQKISTQEDLLALIKQEGFQATQATISRDIREIGIVKSRDNNQTFYSLLEKNNEQKGFELSDAYKTFVASIEQAEFTLVIKTAIGEANALASILDDSDEAGLVGTIAGADTIMLIMKNHEFASQLKRKIEAQINF